MYFPTADLQNPGENQTSRQLRRLSLGMILQQLTLTIALLATCTMGMSSRSGKVHKPLYKHLTTMPSHSRPA